MRVKLNRLTGYVVNVDVFYPVQSITPFYPTLVQGKIVRLCTRSEFYFRIGILAGYIYHPHGKRKFVKIGRICAAFYFGGTLKNLFLKLGLGRVVPGYLNEGRTEMLFWQFLFLQKKSLRQHC